MARHCDKTMRVKTRKPKQAPNAGVPLTALRAVESGGIAKKRSFKDKQKERKQKRGAGMVGLVIAGKLRGCEGVADVAFVEWLVGKQKLQESPALLWESYLTEWDQVPAHKKPRSAHKPKNLHSQLRAILKERQHFSQATPTRTRTLTLTLTLTPTLTFHGP